MGFTRGYARSWLYTTKGENEHLKPKFKESYTFLTHYFTIPVVIFTLSFFQRKVVERHIEMEAAVIKQLEAKMPGVENEKLELLLQAILLDERRHHKLLKTLLEILVKGETVTEGDWWDAIWGDVPGLWT